MAKVLFQFGLGCFKKLDSLKKFFKKFYFLKGGMTVSVGTLVLAHSAGQRTCCDSSVLPPLEDQAQD